jgi:hypothetical protein
MVFERRTLPVATLPVDISFIVLWGGEATRAMVSLAGPFGLAGRLCFARVFGCMPQKQARVSRFSRAGGTGPLRKT